MLPSFANSRLQSRFLRHVFNLESPIVGHVTWHTVEIAQAQRNTAKLICVVGQNPRGSGGTGQSGICPGAALLALWIVGSDVPSTHKGTSGSPGVRGPTMSAITALISLDVG